MIRKVCFFRPKKMRFMQIELDLQTKNRSEPAKNRVFCSPTNEYPQHTFLRRTDENYLSIIIKYPPYLFF